MFARLTELEANVANPLGADDTAALPDPGMSTRAALEQTVLPAVTDDRCYVLFSGGRDSSLVLAVATAVARRVGAPDPIPVTAVYPGDPDADESSWQDLVLEHLGIDERIVIPVTAERTNLGPVARRSLRARGLVWPQSVQTQPVFFEQLDHGSLLSGEGGDGFLEAKRITPLTLLRRDWRRPSPQQVGAALGALQPSRWAGARERRELLASERLSWFRRPARELIARDSADARGPLRWDEATAFLLSRRTTTLGLGNTKVGAAEFGLTMSHPLAEPVVVAALAHEGGRWGFPGRTNLFRRLGADLLPDAILARRTKARFNAAAWGADEQEFARGWTGGAFSPELIDEDALRREWLSDSPHPITYLLQHVAWLHAQGIPLSPEHAPVSTAE